MFTLKTWDDIDLIGSQLSSRLTFSLVTLFIIFHMFAMIVGLRLILLNKPFFIFFKRFSFFIFVKSRTCRKILNSQLLLLILSCDRTMRAQYVAYVHMCIYVHVCICAYMLCICASVHVCICMRKT